MKSKIKPRDILEYALYFGLMCLAALAGNGPIRPFGIGLFVGLVHCRKNLWLLAPLLLASALVAEQSWQAVALAGCAVVTIAVAYYIHYLCKKKLLAWHLVVYAFVSQVPVMLVYGVDNTHLIAGAVTLVLSTCFTYACIKLCHYVLVKGVRYQTTTQEDVALAFFVGVLAMGLVAVRVGGILPGMVLVGALYLAAPRLLQEKGLLVCLLCALGCWGATLDKGFVAVGVVWAMAAYLLRTRHPLWTAACIVAADLLLGLALGQYTVYHYANTLLAGGGAALYALLPKALRAKWEGLTGTQDDIGVRYLVNRNRLDLYTKLDALAGVLGDMRTVLDEGICRMPPLEHSKNYLAKELAAASCTGCSRRALCEQALSSSTVVAMYDLLSRAMTDERLTLLTMPAFFGDNCVRPKAVLADAKQLLLDYAAKKEVADAVDHSKSIMCEQLAGLAGVMKNYAAEVKQVVAFDAQREKRVLEALSDVGVMAKECIIYKIKDTCTAVLVVRQKDAEKQDLARTLERLLGKMTQKSVTNHAGGWVSVCYVTAPPYGMATGQHCATKAGSDKSGDTYSVLRLGTDKVLLAVCDGMGSGRPAAGGSSAALSLVESFYTAGIDDSVVLSLVNQLLAVRNEECFQALDMCVVDLRNAHADFIKLGAPESVIRHADRIEVVAGGALPLGILESVTPKVSRVAVAGGDMIILCSDGITESIGIDGVVRMAEQNPTTNPQTLARLTVEDALYVDENDDKTVLCARIFDNT